MRRWVGLRVDDDSCCTGNPPQQLGGIWLWDVSPQLGISKRSRKLVRQGRRHNQLELTCVERSQQIGRGAARGEGAGDDYVRVKDSPHPSAPRTRLVLRLDGELRSVALGKVVPLP